MNSHANDLVTLLRWKAGQMSQADAQAIRLRMDEDALLQKKWRKIRRVIKSDEVKSDSDNGSGNRTKVAANGSSSASETNGSSRHVGAMDDWSSELIAAFVEQSLQKQDSDKIESACYKSSLLMQEVIATYKDMVVRHQREAKEKTLSDSEIARRSSLSVRLEELMSVESEADSADVEPDTSELIPPQVVLSPPTTQELEPNSAQAVPTSSLAVSHTPTDIQSPPVAPLAIQTQSAPRNSRSLLTKIIVVAAAASVMFLIAGATWMIVTGKFDSDNSIAEQDGDSTAVPEDSATDSPSTEETDDASNENASDEGTASDSDGTGDDDSGSTETPMLADDGTTPATDESVDEMVDGLSPELLSMDNFPESSDMERFADMPLVDMSLNTQSQPDQDSDRDQLIPVRPQWNDIRGMLAGRVPDASSETPQWVGANSERVSVKADSWMTLPESWASAMIDGLGEIVLDADSEIRLFKSGASEKEFVIHVRRGRVALKNVPPNQNVSIRNGKHTWEFQNQTAESTIAIDSDAGNPRLQVRAGQIKIDDKEVSDQQQVVFDIKSKKVLSGKVLGNTSAGWVNRPEKVGRLSGRLNEKLLKSDDMMAELRTLRSSKNADTRNLATLWSYHLAPDTEIAASVSSGDKSVRNSTLDWLLKGDIDNPVIRRAWAGVARKTHDGRLAGIFMQVSKMARNKETLKFEQSLFLAAMLNHDEYVWRHCSSYFLKIAFGDRRKYEPDDPKRIRDRASALWAGDIVKVYNKKAGRNLLDPLKKKSPRPAR